MGLFPFNWAICSRKRRLGRFFEGLIEIVIVLIFIEVSFDMHDRHLSPGLKFLIPPLTVFTRYYKLGIIFVGFILPAIIVEAIIR